MDKEINFIENNVSQHSSEIKTNYEIALVIVTYNRKDLLLRCIQAVLAQSLKPKYVLITDNASTDGTQLVLKENGVYNTVLSDIQFSYTNTIHNCGGAGGFYYGMKYAYENWNVDGLWVMDDDGLPDSRCLEYLCNQLSQFDYVAPIVLSDEDHRTCSFTNDHESLEAFSEANCDKNGLIKNWASPFNGVLYSKKLIKAIGFPHKGMYSWGVEYEFHMRAIKAGFVPYTFIKAIHYHPIDRVKYEMHLGRMISVSDVDWKLYCCIRNYTFIIFNYSSKFPLSFYKCVRMYFSYLGYSRFRKFKLITDAFICGLIGNFNRLIIYMK